MMEGFDSEWLSAEGTQRSATYTNLPDGNYRFHVKAVFDGDIDENGAAFNHIYIRILPPWYKTLWALVVYALLAATAVWLFFRFLRRRHLRREEQLAMERTDLKLQMFTDLSHEIRTPLTLVMTPLKAMWEGESDGKRRDIYNLMYRNARRILTIINQLIDMNRIGTPQFRMRFYRTDMVAFMNDIVSAFEHQAVVRNIDCRTMSPRELPDVWIDQGNFDKVVFNILSNAFKFTPDNGTVMISFETYLNSRQSGISVDVPRYLEIRFENSGSHIPPEDMERIFERFGQADGSRSGGSGIGLHLAKRIVELHYGTIEAENTDTGVVFVLRIPLGDAHLSTRQKAETTGRNDTYGIISPERDDDLDRFAAEAAEQQHPAAESGPQRTIYFVDDDADLLKYIHLELSGEYRIETFPDGEKAWEAILADAPDAVVTDLAMPLVDGKALCRKIRENRKTCHLPIIVLTAETAEESECRCLENGADRYLTKPVSLELLKWTIAQAIGVRETLRSKYSTEVGEGNTAGDTGGDRGDRGVGTHDSRFVAKVIESIRCNIEDPELSVEQLSAEIGISRVHLGRKLKESLDMTPSALIRSIRLRHGAYLLVRHNLYVSEVADRVGFASPSSFSNSFRDYFGMSPTEYAAKNADNEDMTTGFDISS
jgi:signal transduction histidine kinase/DNA-binding response OmpR family regulator